MKKYCLLSLLFLFCGIFNSLFSQEKNKDFTTSLDTNKNGNLITLAKENNEDMNLKRHLIKVIELGAGFGWKPSQIGFYSICDIVEYQYRLNKNLALGGSLSASLHSTPRNYSIPEEWNVPIGMSVLIGASCTGYWKIEKFIPGVEYMISVYEKVGFMPASLFPIKGSFSSILGMKTGLSIDIGIYNLALGINIGWLNAQGTGERGNFLIVGVYLSAIGIRF